MSKKLEDLRLQGIQAVEKSSDLPHFGFRCRAH